MSRLIEFLRRAAEFVAALLFGAIVVTFGANIVARYVFSRPMIGPMNSSSSCCCGSHS